MLAQPPAGAVSIMKRVINFPLISVVGLSFLPMYACSNGGTDDQFTFGSFGTTQTTLSTSATTMNPDDESGDADTSTTGDGDGDGDGDPTTTAGDGDGDGDTNTTAGDGDGDTGCPSGEFGCPCDGGTCAPGLVCQPDNTCGLGGGDGDGDPSTTGDGDGDAWDPNACAMPSQVVAVTDIDGEFCSAPCVADGDCPVGPVGTDPACLLLLDPNDVDPSGCVLICDPANDTCPVGASCKDVPNQPGVGVCTYP
jgi:hypothetical protein